MPDRTPECGCPSYGPHTAYCLADLGPGYAPTQENFVLSGTELVRNAACPHHWLEVRTRGWLRLTVCKFRCGARRRFLPVDFNAGVARGTITMLPTRI
jgi:hypothetical protein